MLKRPGGFRPLAVLPAMLFLGWHPADLFRALPWRFLSSCVGGQGYHQQQDPAWRDRAGEAAGNGAPWGCSAADLAGRGSKVSRETF